MTLVRFAGRALYSAFFIADGYKSFTQPDTYVAEVKRTIDAVMPAARKVLPDEVNDRLPEDTRSWVRILAGVQVAAGAAYTLNILRRPAAVALGLTMVPHVVASLPSRSLPAAQRTRSRGNLLRNLALLGGAVIASQDTQGQPSLVYRARYGWQQLGSAADHGRDSLTQQAKVAKANLKAGKAQAELAATRGVFKAKGLVS